MLDALSRNWWALAIRGIVAVLFGILAFVWPQLTLATLVLLFGAYILADGIFAVVHGVQSHGESQRWWAVLLEGIAGIIIGVVAFLYPGITALALLSLIAAWAIITGILEIVAAIQLRRVIEGEWLMVLSGILSIAFGVLLFLYPGAGAVGLIWLIGGYAIVFGVLLLMLAFRLRGRQATGAGLPGI